MIERVLLVEDDDAHAELISRKLTREVSGALELVREDTLEGAIERARVDRMDAVLLDLGLPDSHREETLVRFARAHPDLPVVVLTSEDDVELGSSLVGEGGASDFLVKGEADGRTTLRALRYAWERKHRELELRTYAEELEQSNEALRQFSHLVAHELKQPLNPILLNCAVLRRALDEEDELVRSSLADIESAVRDMGRLVTDMLSFASMSQVRTSSTDVALREVVADARKRLAKDVAARDAEVVVEELPTLPGHRSLLRQLFVNLLGNALKYGRQERPRIVVGAEPEGERVRVFVQDDGPGIAKDEHGRAFDMFDRLSAGPAKDGSGIGLALCRMIVEHHGGTIGIDSDVGRGCKVWFDLPTRRDQDDSSAAL